MINGINVSHTTIYHWVPRIWQNDSIKFGKRKIDSPSIRGKWTRAYIKIKRTLALLYRAIDADVLTLDIWLRKPRTHKQPASCFA